MSCGYSRNAQRVGPEVGARKRSDLMEFLAAVAALPDWAWLLLVGVLALAGGSVYANYRCYPVSFGRALWGTVQLGAGLIAFIAAEVWILFLVNNHTRDDLDISDVILPYRLWAVAFRRLPYTRRPVCLGMWGLTAALGAAVLIGGFTYWLPRRWMQSRPKPGVLVIQQYEDDDKPDDESIKDAVRIERIPREKEPAPPEDPEGKRGDTRPVTRCVVIGYLPGRNGKLGGLVLAQETPEGLRYAGIVRHGLTATNTPQLLKQLAPLTVAEAPIRCPDMAAIWVKPSLSCEINRTEVAPDGRLVDPNFHRLLPPPGPSPGTGVSGASPPSGASARGR